MQSIPTLVVHVHGKVAVKRKAVKVYRCSVALDFEFREPSIHPPVTDP